LPSLLDIPRNQSAVVRHVGGDRSFRRRIMEMGLVPGTAVRVVGVAPLGDPITLEVRCGQISIRKEEARVVEVVT
jgi:ferrous iron transport protein A